MRYDYEYQFTTDQLVDIENSEYLQMVNAEVIEWLENNTLSPYMFIWESGCLWGVAFSNRKDAMYYQLTWGGSLPRTHSSFETT